MSEFPVCNVTSQQAEEAKNWINTKLQECTNNGANTGKSITVEVAVDRLVISGDFSRVGAGGSKTDIRRRIITSYNEWNSLSEQEKINKIQEGIENIVTKARKNNPYKGADDKGNAKTVPVFLRITCGRDSVSSPTTGVGNP